MTRLGIFNGYDTEEVSFQHLTGENWETRKKIKRSDAKD